MASLDFDRYTEWKLDSSLPPVPVFNFPESRQTSISARSSETRLTLTQALTVCPAFKHMPIEFLSEVAQSCVIKDIPAGTEIWHQGDDAFYFMIVLSGLVEMSVVSSSGSHNILGVFGVGDVVGIPAIVSGIPYPATAKAANGPVKVLHVYSSRMPSEITHQSGYLYALKNALVLHDRVLRDKIDVLCAGRIEQRLARLFFTLGRRLGTIREGTCLIPFHFSRNQISRMIDARLETVIRVMSRWEKAGLLKRHKEGFVVPCCLKFEILMDFDGSKELKDFKESKKSKDF